MTENRETRIKRLRLRCWRRGTKEMDLLLGKFADSALEGLDNGALDDVEALMEENDNDLYLWISGAEPVPEAHEGIVAALREFHGIN